MTLNDVHEFVFDNEGSQRKIFFLSSVSLSKTANNKRKHLVINDLMKVKDFQMTTSKLFSLKKLFER